METFKLWRRIESIDQLVSQHSMLTMYSGLPKEFFIEDAIFFSYGDQRSDIYITPVRPETIELLKANGYEEIKVPCGSDRRCRYLSEEDQKKFSYLEVEAKIQNRNRASCIAFAYASANNIKPVKIPADGRYKVIQKPDVLKISSKTGEIESPTLENVGKYYIKLIREDDYRLVWCDNMGNTVSIRADIDDILKLEYNLIHSGYLYCERMIS